MTSATARVRHLARRAETALARFAVTHGPTRRILNSIYRPLSIERKARVFERYGAIFIGRTARCPPGDWSIPFASRDVRVPLRAEHMRLDWAHAIGLAGHDWPVKETYRRLLCSRDRPAMFVDIGANFGTHSLLFLCHGIPTITVEPNALCHEYFRGLCRFNGIAGFRLEPVALGDEAKPVTLSFPVEETWLGTVSDAVREDLARHWSLESETVPQRRLDELLAPSLDELPAGRLLIKIDTEGAEERVLRGGSRTLQRARLLVVFESMGRHGRDALFALFGAAGYAIADLPWDPQERSSPHSAEAFRAVAATNFIAYPVEHAF